MNGGQNRQIPARRVACALCGREDVLVAEALGVCVACIRGKVQDALQKAMASHAQARKLFGLPAESPAMEEGGIHCKICSQNCRMNEGELGYCGLRWNENGKLLSLSTPYEGVFHAYPYRFTPNHSASASGLSVAGCRDHSPFKPVEQDLEAGSLAIFLYGCPFDCLFCQNTIHNRYQANWVRPAEALIDMTLENNDISHWYFFGGSPEPQLPFAINASQKILTALRGKRRLNISFEWAGCGYPELVKKAARIAYESGGTVTFNLIAWDETLHLALTGSSNKMVYENLAMVARAFPRRTDQPSWLWVTTRLIPGYIDEREVEPIAGFLSGLDSSIPYRLLVFHPGFMMEDLPITPREQVRACYQVAKNYLSHVHVGNVHLLGLPNEEALVGRA